MVQACGAVHLARGTGRDGARGTSAVLRGPGAVLPGRALDMWLGQLSGGR